MLASLSLKSLPKISEITIKGRGTVRWFPLNQPEVVNAITSEMLELLNKELKNPDDDRAVRILLITGAGRGFCTGLDLKQGRCAGEGIGRSGLENAEGQHYSTKEICTVTLQSMDAPVIAAINGPVTGYVLDLALGCDMRIMSDVAVLMPGFAKIGVILESRGTWCLPRLFRLGENQLGSNSQ